MEKLYIFSMPIRVEVLAETEEEARNLVTTATQNWYDWGVELDPHLYNYGPRIKDIPKLLESEVWYYGIPRN